MKYEMVCLIDDILPMIVRDQVEDKINELNPIQKI
jgi:hypothetical protein